MSRFEPEYDLKGLTYEHIPGEPDFGFKIQQLIPSIEDNLENIIKVSFPPELQGTIQLVKKITKGGNNDIYIYKSQDLFIVARISKYPSFRLESSNHISVLGETNIKKIEFLNQAVQSKLNWENASAKELSPHLFNYGYIKNRQYFYNYIICEKMDSDLSDYYEKGPGRDSIRMGSLTAADSQIAEQLVDLLYATTNTLGLICFDIKPANCMINYKDGNIVVKLIDWDGDWCQDYSYITSNRTLKDSISILSVIIMAAHFYIFLDWNIFYTYFSNPDDYGNYVRDNKESLKALFCDNLTDSEGNRSRFDFFQKHYFKIKDRNDKPATCEDAFDLTFERAHYLNRAAKTLATRQPPGVTRVGGRKKIKNKSVPRRYIPKGLTKRDKKKQREMLKKSRKMYKKGKYFTRKKVKSFKSKKSSHITNAQKIYKIDKIYPGKELANKTGCSVDALKKIVKKGEGAYFSSGSRPNQTAQSWGYARLASAITGGKSAAVDYNILEKGCEMESEALRLAKKAKRKYGYGKRKTPQVKL